MFEKIVHFRFSCIIVKISKYVLFITGTDRCFRNSNERAKEIHYGEPSSFDFDKRMNNSTENIVN